MKLGALMKMNPVLSVVFYPDPSLICILSVSFADQVGLHNLCNLQSGFSEILWQFPVTVSGRVIYSHWTNNCVQFASDAFVIVKVTLAKSASFVFGFQHSSLSFHIFLVIISNSSFIVF